MALTNCSDVMSRTFLDANIEKYCETSRLVMDFGILRVRCLNMIDVDLQELRYDLRSLPVR